MKRFNLILIIFISSISPALSHDFHLQHKLAPRQNPLTGLVNPLNTTDTTITTTTTTTTTTSSESSSSTLPPVINPTTTTTTTTSSSSETESVVSTTSESSSSSTSTPPKSTSSTPVSTSSTSRSVSQVIVTVTSVLTNADGSLSTSTTVQESAAAKASSSSNTGKTWGIVGGVVGGVLLLVGILLVIWRFTQRRFADLDNGGEEIKWPELQPDGAYPPTSTLNPMGTRRTGGAGIEMSGMGDHDDEWDSRDDTAYSSAAGSSGDGRGSWYNNGRGGAGASVEHLANYGAQMGVNSGYYDPYLGPSAAPSPAPPNLPPLPPPNRSYSPYYADPSQASSRHSLDDMVLGGDGLRK